MMPIDLRAIRKRLGLTQAELAAVLGITRQTVNEHERGRAPIPRERWLAVFALVYWHRSETEPPLDEIEREIAGFLAPVVIQQPASDSRS
jgi:DNA-binding XRE family transcriptional regulator